MDRWARTSTRAVLLSVSGQFRWPRAGSYVTASGQDLMAADRFEPVGPGRDIVRRFDRHNPDNCVFEINFPMRRPGDPVPDVMPRELHGRIPMP